MSFDTTLLEEMIKNQLINAKKRKSNNHLYAGDIWNLNTQIIGYGAK